MSLRQPTAPVRDPSAGALIEAAFAAIDVMVLVIEPEALVISSANPSFCLTTGWEPGEVSGQSLSTLYDPQLPPQTRRRIESILTSGGAGRIEFLARRRNGTGFWVDLALSPIAATAGRFYAALLRDITRQREDLAEIARAHDLIQAVANGVPGVVYQFVVEADGRRYYSFISEGSRELFGIEAVEVTSGSHDRILAAVAPEARPALLRSIDESRRTLSAWLHVFRCRNGDEWRWIRGSAKPHRLTNGATVWNGMLIDITEQHEARAAAEAASKAKSDFIANISHELRTPLNAVIGLAEVLERGLSDPAQADYATEIRNSGQALLDLINTVLDLSRIDAGRLELAEAEIEISALVAPCLEVLRGRLVGRSLTFDNRLDRMLPRLVIDRRRIRQALANLLSNAVKFTPDGGGITLDAEVMMGDGSLALSVADTGIGMAPEKLARVFEPFVQLDTGLDRRNSGVGLGLTLSRAVVEAHGGRIALSSEPGRGTVASLILPAERVRWG
jgi:PAS domain S-box-containing protein